MQTFIPPREYIRLPPLRVSNLCVCVTTGLPFFFYSLFRSFYVLLSAPPASSPPSLISSLAGPLHVFGQYYPRRVRNVLIPFSLIWDLLSVAEATRSFSIYGPEISSIMLEGTSRFLENVRYVRPFLHEMEFVACLLDPSKCLPTDCTV